MNEDFIDLVIQKNFKLEHIAAEIPSILDLKTVMQNPDYHKEGSVYIHTSLVCQALKDNAEWKLLSARQKGILYLAAMFHDIGKKICTKEVDGKITSPGHAGKGAKLFRELCLYCFHDRYVVPFQEREAIAALIQFHGLPVWFLEKQNMDRELVIAAESVQLEWVYLLAKADMAGRECSKAGISEKVAFEEQVEYFAEYAKELGCWNKPIAFANSYSRFQYFHDENKWHGDVLFDITEFDVYIMSGLVLAGKDTYIQEHFDQIPTISLDEIRKILGINPNENQTKVVLYALEKAKEYLRRKQSFVWNATNIVRETRSKLCRLFSGYGARVRFIYVEVPRKEQSIRNATRDRKIPEPVIDQMIRKLDIVYCWEGYSVEYNVHI